MNLNKILLSLIILKNYNSELIKSLSQNINIPGNHIVKLIGLAGFLKFIRPPLRNKINNQFAKNSSPNNNSDNFKINDGFEKNSSIIQNSVNSFYDITTSIPFLCSLYLHYKDPNQLPKKYLLQFLAYNMGVRLSAIYLGNYLYSRIENNLTDLVNRCPHQIIQSDIRNMLLKNKFWINFLTQGMSRAISIVIKNIPELYFTTAEHHIAIILGNSKFNLLYCLLANTWLQS